MYIVVFSNICCLFCITVFNRKIFKRYKVCDCFLDVACYSLLTNAGFVSFEKMCKEKFDTVDNRIFCILKAERNVSRATYIVCCSNFVDFQIDLFKGMTDVFPLVAIACYYAERRRYGILLLSSSNYYGRHIITMMMMMSTLIQMIVTLMMMN